jgi:hypothetical protein
MHTRAEQISASQPRPYRAGLARMALLVLIAIAAACGSKSPGSTTPSEGDQAHAAGGSQPTPLAKFHGTLAPRWHAAAGPQRMTDTCAAIPEFRADADAVAAAGPIGGGDPAAYASGSKELTASVAALDSSCQAKDAAGFETAFTRVHDSFHKLTEVSGEGHAKHGEAAPEPKKEAAPSGGW